MKHLDRVPRCRSLHEKKQNHKSREKKKKKQNAVTSRSKE